MKTLLSCTILLIAWTSSQGDTLTLMNNRSVNGKVTYDQGNFFVEAHFRDQVEPKKLAIERKEVKSVEINSTIDNPGSPPTWIANYEDGKFYAENNPDRLREPLTEALDASPPTTDLMNVSKLSGQHIAQSENDLVRLSNGGERKGGLTLLNQRELNITVNARKETVPRTEVNRIVVGH